jgi:H+-transporting ATPase
LFLSLVISDVIRFAKLCSNADKKDDPIDKAVLKAYEESEVSEEDDEYTQTAIIGFNPTVKRVVAFVDHRGRTLTVAKGLPAKIIDTTAGGIDDHECQWKVVGWNDKKFLENLTTTDTELSRAGYKTIGIAMCEGDARTDSHGPWKFVGLMPMLDPPRADTKATIASLNHANISVKMITGDHGKPPNLHFPVYFAEIDFRIRADHFSLCFPCSECGQGNGSIDRTWNRYPCR